MQLSNPQKVFDLRVHHRDPKTGKIMRENNYVMRLSKEHGTTFERDGIEYYPDGSRVHKAQEVERAPVVAPPQEPEVPQELPPQEPELPQEENPEPPKEPEVQKSAKGHKK